MTLQRLTIRRPDDWHVHLRDGDMLRLVAPFTARQFGRAFVMPNLVPPVTTIGAAADYRERIWQAAGRDFEPADSSRKPVPVILNQSAARALFGAGDPLGKVVDCAERRIGAMQVVGIIGDARVLAVAQAPGPQAFAPLLGGCFVK